MRPASRPADQRRQRGTERRCRQHHTDLGCGQARGAVKIERHQQRDRERHQADRDVARVQQGEIQVAEEAQIDDRVFAPGVRATRNPAAAATKQRSHGAAPPPGCRRFSPSNIALIASTSSAAPAQVEALARGGWARRRAGPSRARTRRRTAACGTRTPPASRSAAPAGRRSTIPRRSPGRKPWCRCPGCACAAPSGYRPVAMAGPQDKASAAPTPCSTRAPSSQASDGAAAHSAKATVPSAPPHRKTRRWPSMSPTRPNTSINAA